MKKYITLGILLISIVGFVSCQQDIEEVANYAGKKISITAQTGEDAATRTTLNGFETQWTAGDRIGVFSPQSGDSNNPLTAATSATVSAFNGDMVWGKGLHNFYAYYPYTDGEFDNTAVPVSLSATQTQSKGNNADHISALDYMVAAPLIDTTPGDEVSFQFGHLFTLLEFRVVGEGEISTIQLSADPSAKLAFSGGTIDISQTKPTGNATYTINYPETTNSSVDLTLTTPATLTEDSETTPALYMMINPVDLTGQQFSVNMTIDGRPKTITTNGFQFERGRKYTLVAVPEKDMIIVENAEYMLEYEGGTLTIDVQHNLDFDITIEESAQSWIKRTEARALETTSLSFIIDAFEEEGERTGKIFLSKGNIKQTIIVRQKGVDLIALQREALIAIYNAMGGDDWTNNTNWCSDRPVSEWYGIFTDWKGNVTQVNLGFNNLTGYIPDEIGNLSKITYLTLGYNNYSCPLPKEISKLTNLQSLHLTNITSFPAEISACTNLTDIILTYGQLTEEIFTVPNLTRLAAFYQSGTFPKNFGDAKSLRHLEIFGSNGFAGTIPSSIENLTNLETLSLSRCSLDGSDLKVLGKLNKLKDIDLSQCGLRGEIPPELANCKNLSKLNLSDNNLYGGIPEEIASLPNLEYLFLYENNLSGSIPESLLKNKVCWDRCWGYILNKNNFKWESSTIDAVNFDVVDLKGNKIVATDEYAKNKYTALFQFSTNQSQQANINNLKEIYEIYKNKGFDILAYSTDNVGSIHSYVSANNIPWKNIAWNNNNLITEFDRYWTYGTYYPYKSYPLITLVDPDGKVVFFSDNLDVNFIGLYAFLNDEFGGGNIPSYYTSTDYSANGQVTTLQKATQGNGIDIILMGDAYSDRLIADGTYEQDMRKTMEFFFSEEPYKSHRNMFNVYAVTAVSRNEEYGTYTLTALNGVLGGASRLGGDHDRCVSYAKKAISPARMDDALIIAVMNSDSYDGVCYMFYPPEGDYGRGLSIAYFTKGTDDAAFEALIHHEAGGHGFAKLADEYAYEFSGQIPAGEIASVRYMESFGRFKNVDFTNNPSQVKWAKFLSDNRYSQDGLGIYEGAFTYWKGAYRPTENSIMRYNTGGFNAPSREAIYYRIHKLAYGSGWTYNYEDFVAYDAINRTTSRTRQAEAQTKPFKPTGPPVLIPHSWREAK